MDAKSEYTVTEAAEFLGRKVRSVETYIAEGRVEVTYRKEIGADNTS